MNSWKLTIQGLVQGVGFRPQMLLNAVKLNLPIEIANTVHGVEIIYNANSMEVAKQMEGQLLNTIPTKARITATSLSEIPYYTIRKSNIVFNPIGPAHMAITPDMAWCNNCKTEFLDSSNRRNSFYFNACTDCGARFSVMTSLPFERENTTHSPFIMCEKCAEEYHNIDNPRAYSQLIACPHCNFNSSLSSFPSIIDTKLQIQKINELLHQGNIVAIKGVAGFLFILDCFNANAIGKLRQIKNRPTKPLAIMAQDIEWVHRNFFLSNNQSTELQDSHSPIVILKPKDVFLHQINSKAISGVNKSIGVMLPAAAYQYQLCIMNRGAIIATSANLSHFPLEFQNGAAHHNLSKYTKHIWTYDREIAFPQDDSVINFSSIYKHKIILRRARGYSPTFSTPYFLPKNEVILAMGAEMKSTIAIAYQNQLIISPYLGSLLSIENLTYYQNYMEKLLAICQVRPTVILIDLHPQFQYRKVLENVEMLKDVPLIEIAHHEAHFGAILGEHHTLHSKEPIVGVIMDGMGYGHANEILGGEIFLAQNASIVKIGQFPFFRYLLNDKMSIHPKLSFFSLMEGDISVDFKSNYSEYELNNYSKVMHKQLLTNSIGRVFDALAFVFGFRREMLFEGETSLWLEPYFEAGLDRHGVEYSDYYMFNSNHNWKSIFDAILIDLKNELSLDTIALKFLNTIIQPIMETMQQQQSNTLALSGGVFQNSVLLDVITKRCQYQKIKLLLHHQMSPNDENISFGQVMIYHQSQIRNKLT